MKQIEAAGAYLEAGGAKTNRRRAYRAAGKRVFDAALAVALFPIVGLLILILGVGAMVADGGRPFFGHARVGRRGREFLCWKIRTMVPDAEARLAAHLAADPEAAEEWRVRRKLTRDPRITRYGDFLRRSSLDELPQIWNVLRGDMSFVGPRPVPEKELLKYGAARADYVALRPGITGLWQVSGRNALSYEERVALDVRYQRTLTFWLDLRLLLRTAKVVFRPTGL